MTASPTAAAPSAGLVYIVEDDAAVRSALQLLARSCGWETRAFARGEDFLQTPPANGPACLVLDLNMPGLDGESVLRLLKARGSRLPVLVVTGDRQGPRLERVRQLGARAVLLKPFGDQAFELAVQNCLNPPRSP